MTVAMSVNAVRRNLIDVLSLKNLIDAKRAKSPGRTNTHKHKLRFQVFCKVAREVLQRRDNAMNKPLITRNAGIVLDKRAKERNETN
jgi:hypothetical protein